MNIFATVLITIRIKHTLPEQAANFGLNPVLTNTLLLALPMSSCNQGSDYGTISPETYPVGEPSDEPTIAEIRNRFRSYCNHRVGDVCQWLEEILFCLFFSL